MSNLEIFYMTAATGTILISTYYGLKFLNYMKHVRAVEKIKEEVLHDEKKKP
jgi:hypothetical protein